MRQACRIRKDRGKCRIESSMANQCFACDKSFIQSKSLENHMKTCSSMPGLVYKFEKKHILTFEDIVKFMGEVPFAIYFALKQRVGKNPTTLMKMPLSILSHMPL